MGFSKELIEKAKACKTTEELLALAKENGYELSLEEAELFLQDFAEGELADAELDNVSGGMENIMMKYRLYIFDLDGTILDTLEDLTNSTNHALKVFGCPERSSADVRQFVGNGILKLIERAAPSGTDDTRIGQIYREFNAYYRGHSMVKTKPYPGIQEMILTLRKAGAKTAVVSNKADYAVQDLVRHYFSGYFDYAAGEKENVQKKPAPDSINNVLSTLHFSKKDAVYIGDSEVDIQTAANAGLDHIIVTWGFRKKLFLENAGAKIFAGNPDEILEIAGIKKKSMESTQANINMLYENGFE